MLLQKQELNCVLSFKFVKRQVSLGFISGSNKQICGENLVIFMSIHWKDIEESTTKTWVLETIFLVKDSMISM